MLRELIVQRKGSSFYYLSPNKQKIKLYSLSEVAALAGCDPDFIYRRINSGLIPMPDRVYGRLVFSKAQAATVKKVYELSIRATHDDGYTSRVCKLESRADYPALKARIAKGWHKVKLIKKETYNGKEDC